MRRVGTSAVFQQQRVVLICFALLAHGFGGAGCAVEAVEAVGIEFQVCLITLMDTNGIRAMGYFDASDLNYYYFMASNFATSDRWFSPVMDRTQINRMYLLAATSAGHAHPLAAPETPLTVTTIFEELQNAGITWKIYVDPDGTSC